MIRSKCYRHIWTKLVATVISPVYREDGMIITRPNVRCKFCNVSYDKYFSVSRSDDDLPRDTLTN
jgi:hypothetical protein